MNRRTFIISSLSAGIITVAGGTAWQLIPRNNEDLSITNMLRELKAMNATALKFNSTWSTGHHLVHMAQSIEYSMTGYPMHKSGLFKNTVGKAAFSAFSSKGYMKHNLEENIPGAPAIQKIAAEAGMSRLITALESFQLYRGKLAEHFAYGPLTQDEYALAHVLHIKDHFSRLIVTIA